MNSTDVTNANPFDFLMNLGKSSESLLLIGGPLALMLVVILIYGVLVALKRRRDNIAIQSEMILEEAKETPPTSLDKADIEPIHLPEERIAPPTVEKVSAPSDVEEIRKTDHTAWLSRLKTGLSKTRTSLQDNLSQLFSGKVKINEEVLEKLHETLYRADIGVKTADKLVNHARQTLTRDQAASWETVRGALKEEVQKILASSEKPILKPEKGPWVILVVGVNGVGKTTTIGKLAASFLAQNKSVLLCAADTFRAAAIEQLKAWGDRLGVEVIKHQAGSDPAAVACDAVKAAIARNSDVLIIDTAGRLHNKQDLMAELNKINRIVSKDLPGAPHETWLVIDATTGQNAVMQVKAFKEVVELKGLVVTKLDGTAKGGVVVGIADQFQLPIRYIGVGEKAVDLHQFNPSDYSEMLFEN